MASSNTWPSLLLPFELVEEILHRSPVRSLARFKSVCKQWYALLENDKRFIYKHLEHSEEGFIRLSFGSPKIFTRETKTLFRGQIPYGLGWKCQLSNMLHCDGLLFCKCSNSKLAVWNPSLSGVTWIEPSPSHGLDEVQEICGFGYGNASLRNYKILRFHHAADYRNDQGIKSKVEIYDFKSKLWTSVDASFDFDWSFHPHSQDVPMNGNMYWIAQRRRRTGTGTEIFIQSFDFSTETFKPICGVPFENHLFQVTRYDHAVLLSGFKGDRLSLLQRKNYVGIEVWVTNKVNDEVVSWSKYLNVSQTRPGLSVLASILNRTSLTYFIRNKTNTIMLCTEEEDAKESYFNIYEISEVDIRKQVETGRHIVFGNRCCYVYAPSLVPVP